MLDSVVIVVVFFFFFKQKTAYEILRSDWSSDVCSSDLSDAGGGDPVGGCPGSVSLDRPARRERHARRVQCSGSGGTGGPSRHALGHRGHDGGAGAPALAGAGAARGTGDRAADAGQRGRLVPLRERWRDGCVL